MYSGLICSRTPVCLVLMFLLLKNSDLLAFELIPCTCVLKFKLVDKSTPSGYLLQLQLPPRSSSIHTSVNKYSLSSLADVQWNKLPADVDTLPTYTASVHCGSQVS